MRRKMTAMVDKAIELTDKAIVQTCSPVSIVKAILSEKAPCE